jgi:hypothetical protein
MSVAVFECANGSDEAPYMCWLETHPDGILVNTRRRPDPTYAVLHRSTCTTIRRATRGTAAAPFTGRGYIKICADSESELLAWARRLGGNGFSRRCTLCKA